MTQEEAIRRIKARFDRWALDNEDMKAVQTLISELTESEDERIRKHLIEIVETYWGTTNDPGKAADLAYLEKQKEQKHPNGCFTCDEYKKGYEEGRRNGFTAGYNKAMKEVEQKEQKPIEFKNDELVEIIKGEFEGFRRLLKKKGIDYEPQRSYWEAFARLFDSSARKYVKEQKPAEIDEYEIIKKHITDDVLSSEVNKRLKECGWYVTDEKPAGATINGEPISIENQSVDIPLMKWSEEDEERIAEIEFAVMQMNTKRVDTKDKCLAWLKSLRPQPKQEWSDEDKKIL